MKHLLLVAGLCLTSIAGAWAQACAGIPSLPSQDCQGAIPLCGFRYTYPTGAICGDGEVNAEIPPNTCLGDERNTTWYVFNVRKAGLLKFAIVPLDGVTPPDSGALDYDWALFKLPAGSVNTPSICSQLNATTNDWVVSCNYSAKKGATGILDTSGMVATDEQGASGSKWNQPIMANAGETYVLAVDNFTGDTAMTGYAIRFRDTADLRTADDQLRKIADIQPTTEPFYFQFVDNQAQAVVLTTTRQFQCSRMVTGAVRVFNPNNLSQQYTVSSFAPEGNCGSGFTNKFRLSYTPYDPSTSSTLKLVIQDSIIDICGNITTRDTLLLAPGIRMSVKKGTTVGGFNIYPQPNKGSFQLDLRSLPGTPASMDIREAISGRELWTSAVRGGEVNSIEPKKAIAPGVYLVEVRQGMRRLIQKMVVER